MTVLLVIPGSIFLFTAEGFAPHSRWEVERKLDNSLLVKYEYISTEIMEKTALFSNHSGENVYTFKDENGIEFMVMSRYIYWGGLEMTAQKESRCDYADKFLLAHHKEVENALEEYLQPDEYSFIEGYFSRYITDVYKNHYEVYVSDYNDLPRIADAVIAAVNAIPPIPILTEKYIICSYKNENQGAFNYSYIPKIIVIYKSDIDGKEYILLPCISFLCMFDEVNIDFFENTYELLDREILIDKLEKNFNNKVRKKF